MIRIICAWALLLLAASPFTAPFSTCDVGALVGNPSHILALSFTQTAHSLGVLPSNRDANGVAPTVTRTQLRQDVAVAPLDVQALALRRLLAAAIHQPFRDPDRAPDWSPPQSPALRL